MGNDERAARKPEGQVMTLNTATGLALDDIANRRGTGRREKPTDIGHRPETDDELRARVLKFYGLPGDDAKPVDMGFGSIWYNGAPIAGVKSVTYKPAGVPVTTKIPANSIDWGSIFPPPFGAPRVKI